MALAAAQATGNGLPFSLRVRPPVGHVFCSTSLPGGLRAGNGTARSLRGSVFRGCTTREKRRIKARLASPAGSRRLASFLSQAPVLWEALARWFPMQSPGIVREIEPLQRFRGYAAPHGLEEADVPPSPEKAADLAPSTCHVCGQDTQLVCPSCGLPFCLAHGWGKLCCIRCYRFTLVALPVAGLCWVLWQWFVVR
jgi:hypothetical protein